MSPAAVLSQLWSLSILARLQLVMMAAPAVVHNLLLEKISLLNLPGLVLLKESYEGFALLFQYNFTFLLTILFISFL